MRSYRYFTAITALFVTCLIISNIIAVKLAAFGPLYLPAAVIIFPVAYIFGDVLTEVYGYARARQVIWLGFGCNLLAVTAIWIGGKLPSAPFWTDQAAYAAILGFTPRLLAASFIAYLAGEFLNAFALARLKIATQGRLLWLRTIGSTLVGQLADSGIFITTAFIGVIPAATVGQLILNQWLFKSAYEALVTPLTYAVVNFLKRAENEDYYDRETNFNPVALS